ncbi:MAG TPA: hypothetical protein VKA30_13225 [Actinomycetota bacterium]|nr:hypothetical protein [Actinomycetota bacterium]
MRGSDRPQDHHPARLIRAAAALAVLTVIGGAAAAGAQEPVTVRLPTAEDAVAFAPGVQKLLGPKTNEAPLLPGPVRDAERITVTIRPDGTPVSVDVVQRLTLSGLGDFDFTVAGPARDVQALPGSGNEPGLRRGAILWEGFSAGTKRLAAQAQLFPELEAVRLPLSVRIAATVGGASILSGPARSGPLRLTVSVANRTAIPIALPAATADPATVAPALDAIRSALQKGSRPVPGRGGVPTSITATRADGARRTVRVAAPFHAIIEVAFSPGTVSSVGTDHGAVRADGDAIRVRLSVLLGGGRPASAALVITGTAKRLARPTISVTATPAVPSATVVRPPEAAASWQDAAASQSLDGAAMLRRTLEVMWMVARLRQYDAYLGNPDVTGPARTTYQFHLAASATAHRNEPTIANGVGAVGAFGLSVLAAFVLLGLTVWWARS